MDQEQIDKLRAAGYTDDDIRDFAANQPKLNNVAKPQADETLPDIDVTKPSDTLSQAQAAGVPTGARESSFIDDFSTVAPVILAENAGKFALGGLGAGALTAGALYKSGKTKEFQTEKLRQEGIQNRFDQKLANQAAQAQAQAAPRPVAPVAPSTILDASGRPMQSPQPVNPATIKADTAARAQQAAAQKITNLPPSMLGQAGRMAGRLLPGVGTALNAADAYGRFNEGDYLGAGIAGIGAAASPFPIAGTVVGAGTGAINAYRDYLKRQEEEKKRMQQ